MGNDDKTTMGSGLAAAAGIHDDTEDGWDDVEMLLTAGAKAVAEERGRCAAIVLDELECGRLRGVPETSGTMRILHRIAAAITRGV